MRLLIIVTFLFCPSCNSPNKSKEHVIQTDKLYFDFNQVLHFKSQLQELEIKKLITDNNLNEHQKLIATVLLRDSPNNLNSLDTNYLIQRGGYTKRRLSSASVISISQIFSAKNSNEVSTAKCAPVYRDILVLMKSNKITGLAKICFECEQYYFVGQLRETKYFGSNKDYLELKRALE